MSIKGIKWYFEKELPKNVDKDTVVKFFNEIRDSLNKNKLDFSTLVFIQPVIPTQINGAGIYYGKRWHDLELKDRDLYKKLSTIFQQHSPNFLIFIKQKNLNNFNKNILQKLSDEQLKGILPVVY